MKTEAGSETFPDRPYLRHSRQLNWDRAPAAPMVEAAINALAEELDQHAQRQRARKAVDRRRLQATLGAITLDLFVAAGTDPDLWLAYPRRNEEYAASRKRYMSADVTPTMVREVADFLAAAGYADATRGSYRRTALGATGYRSRLRATRRLVEFMTSRGVGLEGVGVRPDAELIRLKGEAASRGATKPLLGYADTPATIRMREHLRRWAAVASRFDIKPPSGRFGNDRPEDDNDDGAGESVDVQRPRLYRVFNNGSWAAGGRFYGGWWMRLPSAQRQAITIDGDPVVELDFKALHPRIAYHLAGCPLPPDADPYDLGGEWQAVDRSAIKVAFNQLLAVSAGGGIKRPSNIVLPRRLSYRRLVEALEHKHRPIRAWLRAGRALELQHIDSQIAESVLTYFTEVLERPVLPVHDSFVVAARDEYKLGETMALAYRAVLGQYSALSAWPVIKGWRGDGEAEARLIRLLGEVNP